MHEYPVWDLFEKIGQVNVAEAGLYLHYEAKIKTTRPGFLRLYYHKGDSTLRLGLFSEENGMLCCSGRVSLRSLGGEWENCSFSIHDMPIEPLTSPLDGGFLPQNALEYWKSGRRFVAIRHENDLPEEILPFFCFLKPEILEGTPCLVFEADDDGKPVIS